MDDSTIMPGSPVRAADGVMGEVYRVIADAGGIALEALIVRADLSGQFYRVPATLISSVRHESGHGVIYLSADLDTLQQYQVPEVFPADSDDEPTQHVRATSVRDQAGSFIGRLQAGLDSLASGVREALGSTGDGEEPADEEDEDVEAARIPLVEEYIVTHTEWVRNSTLRVHKSVESVEETVSVPVSREEPEVDYISVDEYDAKAPYQPGETYIPILGERLFIEKRQVITGYLRVRKRIVQEDQQVTETLRRERLTFDQQSVPPDAPPAPAEE